MGRAPTDTRQRLIEAARLLFWQNGYAGTGMAAILKRARANSGSFYYFFDSKEDLLLAVLEEYKKLLYPMVLARAFEQVADPIERVFAVLAGYREALISTDCTYGCPIGRLALEMGGHRRKAHRGIAANFDGWVVAARQCLEQAGERLPPGLDRGKLAQFVLTVMEGAVMQSRAHRSIAPFDAAVELLRDYFDRLLAAARAARRSQSKRRKSNEKR